MSWLALRLTHIEIEVCTRHHNSTIPLAGCLATRRHILPTIYHSILGERACINGLIPYAGLLAELLDNLRHAVHKMGLQSFAIHPLCSHQSLAVGAFVPLRHTHLITANMHPLRWEHLCQLAENILQQSVVTLLRCTHHIAGIVAIRGLQTWGIVTQHIGTHTSQIVAMTRQINFGDNLNISHSGILHHLTHLLLREVTAITLSPLAITSRHRRVTTTKGTHLTKVGVRFYLYAPALIIREMNMELVNLVVC